MKNSRFSALFIRNIILVILLYAAVVGIQVGLFLGVQKLIADYSIEIPMLWTLIAMTGFMLLFMIVNKIRLVRFAKKYTSMERYIENVEEVEHKYKEAQENYLASEKSVMKKKNRIIVMKVLLFLYFVLMVLCCAAGAKKDSTFLQLFVIAGVILMFISPLVWIDLFMPFQVANEYQLQELTKTYYPEFYKVVEEAAETLGCNKPIKLYPIYNSSVSVSSSSNGIQICLDCEETALLSRDELYQVMLHEIAHVINSDTKRSRRLEHFCFGMERFGSLTTRLFFSADYIEFTFMKMVYKLSCTRFYEQLADESVKKFGNSQTYINGLAKSLFLDLYRNCYKPKADFDVYENENIPSNYFYLHLDYFKEYLPVYLNRWDSILRNRILSRQDTHPTFAMRMKAMGVEDYDYSIIEQEGQYQKEQKQLLDLGCKLLEKTNPQFKAAKEQYYLPTKSKWEEYKDLIAKGDNLTNQQKTEFFSVLYDVDREECLKLCNEVLAEAPRNSYANFFKGFILADELDKTCVDHLYIAAEENFNLTESALQCIGEFACKVGDEVLLQQYRDKSKSGYVEMVDRKKKSTLHKNEAFHINSLGENEFNEILDYIVEVGKDVLKNVYSVSRGEGESLLTCYYLEWDRKAKFNEIGKVYDQVFSYLDRYDDGGTIDYHFELRHGFPGKGFGNREDVRISKMIKETQGALIYTKEAGKINRIN